MAWLLWVIGATALGTAAAVALGAFRDLEDDVVHRALPRWWVPVAAALATAVSAPFFAGQPAIVRACYLAALLWGLVLVHIDLRVRRLPDPLVLPAYPAVALALTGCSALTGRWTALGEAAASAGVAVLAFLLLALYSPGGAGGLGLGDVKLAGVLAALLGWFDWRAAAAGLGAGFVIGGLLAAVLLVARRVDRRSHIAFGPAMIGGAYLTVLAAAALTGEPPP